MNAFWRAKSLAEMSAEEWELLCDGCGKCCLHKLQDEDDDQVYYTDVACRYLNLTTARCNDYAHRSQNVPECVNLTPNTIGLMPWLPSTCAYRLLFEGKPLPGWHPLVAKSASKMRKKGISVLGKVVPEAWVPADDYEERIVRWV